MCDVRERLMNNTSSSQTTETTPVVSVAPQSQSFFAFSLYDVLVLVGVSSIIAALVYIGRKLQILDDLRATVHKIKVNVKVVSDYLVKHHNKFNPAELQAYSPLALTMQGKEFVQQIGFDNALSQHKAEFMDFIGGENPRLKYDVEVAAIKSIHALYQKPFMEFLKVFLYNNPTRSIEDVAPTLGVYVRDMYLGEHPEITQ